MIIAIGHVDGSFGPGGPPVDQPPAVDGDAIAGVDKGYLEFTVNILQTVSTDINTLGHLFVQPEVEDEYWQASVTVLLNRIEAGYPAVAPLQPAERLLPFQDKALDALDHSAKFAGIIRANLLEGELDLTEEGATELLAAADAFGEAETILNELLQAQPLPEE